VPSEIEPNLLHTLHRWATGQDENFTTDAFSHLLRHLVSEKPELAAGLLARLTRQQCWASLRQSPPDSKRVEIVTQDPCDEGVPDIKIRAPGTLVYVEVKVESEVDLDQLRRYRAELDRAAEQNKALVLLTRKPVDVSQFPVKPDSAKRWFHVGEWLDDALQSLGEDGQSKTTSYLIRQFTEFLKARRMGVEKISWQLIGGVRSLVYLMQMLREAVENLNGKIARSSGWKEGCGHEFTIGGSHYWAGLYYSEPEKLKFSAWPVNKQLAAEIGHGLIEEYVEKGKKMHVWRNQLNLDSEEVHFFARSKSSQIQCIEQFVKESVQAVALSSLKAEEGESGLNPVTPAPDV
jgi:hypothetical protein